MNILKFSLHQAIGFAKKRSFFTAVRTGCFCMITCVAVLGAEEVVVLAADEWCPINCVDEMDSNGNSAAGFMVDFAREVFARHDIKVEYRVMGWARALIEAREGRINGVIGAYHGDAEGFVFPDVPQVVLRSDAFFTLKSFDWDYDGRESLRKIMLGAVEGYDYGDHLNWYIWELKDSGYVQLLYGDAPLVKNLEKLKLGRIDAVIENEYVFWYVVHKQGEADLYRFAGRARGSENVYIAFSPALSSSERHARLLSEGMKWLEKSGRKKQILQRYGISEE